MKKPKKPPVKAKGGAAGGSGRGTGKRGVGPGKTRGIKPHHAMHHPGAGFKGTGTSGGSGGGSGAPVSHHPAKKAHAAKKRGWSPGWDAECCVAEAAGRILGLSDSQVFELDAACDRTIAGVLEVAGCAPFSLSARGHAALSSAPRLNGTALILGVALPQPHAIAVIDGVWWSWGEPFNPDEWPQLVIEETWLCAG